ncbi:hypothetical protein LFYK43_00930 [Ligilactobacillus salitolerans]|uniref:Uncharacterized protein n=1 Tax=Ligilactobacillus salitolerans TaxID=1808352 RepID=A0A401IQ49_9LACO|nr:hypothetical protein [Ligilactobacillus salitolerans]GBG93634.1 hypothetical protein LFYK43_00930 [Ligilactobacillus salitolerans]
MTTEDIDQLEKELSKLNPQINAIELISSRLQHETDQDELGKQLYLADQKLNQQLSRIFQQLEAAKNQNSRPVA